MAIRDVAAVSVPVSDQERAKAFYVETLGFELISEDDSIPGFHWVRVAPKGASTSLTLVTWFESIAHGLLARACAYIERSQGGLRGARCQGVNFDGPLEPQP